MTTSIRETRSENGSSPIPQQQSLSQLSAKILDQLSISAWVPAATLVLILVALVSVSTARKDARADATGYDILREAVEDIAGMDLQSVLLLIISVVLVTTLTQAFEFSAIQFFEGHWGFWWPYSLLRGIMCSWHRWRKKSLANRKTCLEYAAFARTKNTMLDMFERWKLDILDDELHDRSLNGIPQDKVEEAQKLNWELWCKPEDMHRLEAMDLRYREYPENHRILPTRLGNILRATEDPVFGPSEHLLEGAIRRIFHRLPLPIQSAHDQYRSRLDLYCSLIYVFLFTAAIAVPLLWVFPGWTTEAGAVTSGGVLAILSYRAAITSARRYAGVLWDISEELSSQRPDLP